MSIFGMELPPPRMQIFGSELTLAKSAKYDVQASAQIKRWPR